MKKTLITGITGQDGSYLAERLLDFSYEVHGIIRHSSIDDRYHRIKDIKDKLHLHSGSLENYGSLAKIIMEVKPDEIYHLGAISYVAYTFSDEYSTFNTNFNGTHYLLDLMREYCPEAKFYFAGTSEMYGNTTENPQDENTPFIPCSPYGISKLAAFRLCQYYRKVYKLFISCGILFNHTSPRRGEMFASKKITQTVAKIKLGIEKELRMGNIESKRDFGFAPDYVFAMWRMLQQDYPDDFVIASGETHSIKEIIEIAFDEAGLDPKNYLVIDPKLYRPNELFVLQGDYLKARKILGWKPNIKFEEMIRLMVKHDLKEQNERLGKCYSS